MWQYFILAIVFMDFPTSQPIATPIELDISGLTTWQSSTSYGYHSNEAQDGDITTCARTGKNRASWWKVDLGNEYNIESVKLWSNKPMVNIKLQVGNQHNVNGIHDGHQGNAVCVHKRERLVLGVSNAAELICDVPTRGRYLSIETEGVRPKDLELCDVKVYYL